MDKWILENRITAAAIAVENPVSIDVAVERRNLKLYERSYDRLYPKATRAYNSCLERS